MLPEGRKSVTASNVFLLSDFGIWASLNYGIPEFWNGGISQFVFFRVLEAFISHHGSKDINNKELQIYSK